MQVSAYQPLEYPDMGCSTNVVPVWSDIQMELVSLPGQYNSCLLQVRLQDTTPLSSILR